MSAPAPGPVPTFPFDARPLVAPVDRAATRAFAQELRRTGRVSSSSASGVVVAIIAVVMVVGFGSVVVTMIGAVVGMLLSSAEGGGAFAFLFVLFPPLLVLGLVALAIVGVVRSGWSRNARMFRLDAFARANGMTYVPEFAEPPLPGMIFSLGHSRHASDLVRGDRPRFVEFANYRYTTGSGKNKTTHHWGYVAVKLDVPLPHIVLDAVGNNGLFGSNLPAAFDRDQRLSLEGDFDRYFSLYCPADYERDALYLFTPDIMARFIDNAAALDVEIVDDWLFLYGQREFSTLDPRTWAWLFSVVGALLDKFAQWARWRDERLAAAMTTGITDASAPVGTGTPAPAGAAAGALPFAPPLDALRPPPGVAPQGRRLQRRVPWATIVFGGVIVLFWLLSQFGFFGVIGRLLGL